MTRRIGNATIIEKEPPSTCSECGSASECRPYGKGGALICFKCGMADEDRTKRQFSQRALGETPD